MSGKWASDEAAGDLLASILDETADDARAEEERLQREIRAKAEAERLQRESAEMAKKAEADARISAEMDRQNQAADRRTAKMEALRIEDLKANGEWIDPEVVAQKRREADEQRRRDEEALARSMAASQGPDAASQAASGVRLPEPTPKSNTGLIIGVVFLLVAVIGGGVAMFLINGQYKVDEQTYAKAVYSPKDTEVAVVEQAFTPIPKAAPAPAEEGAVVASRGKKRRRTGRKRSSGKPKKKKSDKTGKKANKKAKELEKMLNSSDPFSAF